MACDNSCSSCEIEHVEDEADEGEEK